MTTSFECPSCGAALEPPTTPVASLQCPYCGTSVIVPEELRPRPVAPPPRAEPEGVTIKIGPREGGAERPEITVNMPLEQAERLERLEEAMVANRRVRRGRAGCGGCGCLSTLVFLALIIGGAVLVFGFSIKNNVMYTCAVSAARKNAQVAGALGAPIEASPFAWVNDYKSSGTSESAHFTTDLQGPKGSGTLEVTGSRVRSRLSLLALFHVNGEDITVIDSNDACK